MNTSSTIRHQRLSASSRRRYLLLSAGALALLAAPACARELTPEFSTRVWVENDSELASVCVNGKDISIFRAAAGSGDAAAQADDLAAKLDDLVSTQNFDAS